jgi:hypothetical protein
MLAWRGHHDDPRPQRPVVLRCLNRKDRPPGQHLHELVITIGHLVDEDDHRGVQVDRQAVKDLRNGCDSAGGTNQGDYLQLAGEGIGRATHHAELTADSSAARATASPASSQAITSAQRRGGAAVTRPVAGISPMAENAVSGER